MWPLLFIHGWLVIQLYHWNNKRLDKKFMKYVRIEFPDNSVVTLSSVSTSDPEALKQIKEHLDDLS